MHSKMLLFLTGLVVIVLGVLAYIQYGSVTQLKHANDARLVVKGTGPTKPTTNNYYNANILQDDVVSDYNSTPPFKYHVLGSTCVVSGRTAVCLLRTKTINIVANVNISGDGHTFVAITKE